jgi:uncharacterized protein (DUF2147 family)
MIRLLLLALACLSLCAPARGEDPGTSVLGWWLTQEGKAVVRLEEGEGGICGHVVWLKSPVYPPGDSRGPAGTPKLDTNNPDPALRRRPLLGLQVLWGFSPPDADGVLKDGEGYDPDTGRTYSGIISLAGPDRLSLRGYVLVSLIGRSSTWTRVDPARYGL